MRLVVVLVALLALSACGGGYEPTPASSVSRVGPPPRGAEAMLARAGAPDAPTPDMVISALGAPTVDRREGAGAMLSWRLPSCALALGFSADRGGVLRLSFVQADAPKPDAPIPLRATCVAEAQARGAGS